MMLEQRPVRDNPGRWRRATTCSRSTAPLDADLAALGPVHADVRLRSGRGDTDVFVRVCDVQPDGASLNVCDGPIRLRPGEPARDDEGVAAVQFELWPTAHRSRPATASASGLEQRTLRAQPGDRRGPVPRHAAGHRRTGGVPRRSGRRRSR